MNQEIDEETFFCYPLKQGNIKLQDVSILRPSLHDDWIDFHARRIIEILQREGFMGYLVGGCVRDLLVGIHPKDFDIATNALPNEVKRKVPHAYVIGRRFKLVLAKRGEQQFEIATFRRTPGEEELSTPDNPIEGDNYFGTSEEDAQRRDFTINALFYDPVKGQLIDYVNGMKDIENRTLRMIGDPTLRLIEDPIRILRAIRLSHKINFTIEEQMRKSIQECAEHLNRSVLPRRREEWIKILRLENPMAALFELYDLGILKIVLPHLHQIFENHEQRDLFQRYLMSGLQLNFNWSDPNEVFLVFIYSYLKALHLEKPFDVEKEFQDSSLVTFMKDELGMFKQEMMFAERIIGFLPALEKTESFLRKGERRQISFLQNDTLPLALCLSELDQGLLASDYFFWIRNLKKHQLL